MIHTLGHRGDPYFWSVMVTGLSLESTTKTAKKARGFAVTRILTHFVMRARHFVKPFPDLVDLISLIVNLAANGAGQHMSVDEG